MKTLALAIAFLPVVPAFAGCPSVPTAAGQFGILAGQIYGPNQQPFVPRGVAVTQLDLGTAQNLLATFPGINAVRVAVYQYSNPATWAPAVNLLTSHSVAVIFEDHQSSDGQDRGGGTGTIFTGQLLAQETSWYAQMGAYYKANPYVMAESTNEPAWSYQAGGQPNMPALVAWQNGLYQAWRSSGNNNPFGFMVTGGYDNQPINPGMSQDAYSSDINTFLDLHVYPGSFGDSTDQAAVTQMLAAQDAAAQQFQSEGGPMPVWHLEYGPSTMGETADPGAAQVLQAVQQSGDGSTAWYFGQGPVGSDTLLDPAGQLSPFGQNVASFISGSGASGCSVSVTATPSSQTSLNVTSPGIGVAPSGTLSDVAPAVVFTPDPPAPGTLSVTTGAPAIDVSATPAGPISAPVSTSLARSPLDYLDQSSWWAKNPAAVAAERALCASQQPAGSEMWTSFCAVAGGAGQ